MALFSGEFSVLVDLGGGGYRHVLDAFLPLSACAGPWRDVQGKKMNTHKTEHPKASSSKKCNPENSNNISNIKQSIVAKFQGQETSGMCGWHDG